mmetsp:Transcript_56231/g.163003  ORF Transcript_56231/g.163003 Transcript_56231/m.163003 type:complete len:84 (-) Transcript_56231:72-323(-)
MARHTAKDKHAPTKTATTSPIPANASSDTSTLPGSMEVVEPVNDMAPSSAGCTNPMKRELEKDHGAMPWCHKARGFRGLRPPA